MKVLIVGFGSIGKRHANLLDQLAHDVSVVTSQTCDFLTYPSLSQALSQQDFQYIVIASQTGLHMDSLAYLHKVNYQGKILIEKPLASSCSEIKTLPLGLLYVAYNLRFHPVLQRLAYLLKEESIVSTHIYVGQYLPDWRPERDYRQTYSSKKSEGGGVIRDLSHELDYLLWIFGDWKKLTASGGHLSNLEIDSEDCVTIVAETTKSPLVTMHLNYLDKQPKREILVNTNSNTITANLITGTIQSRENIEKFQLDRNETYLQQHLAVLDGKNQEYLCDMKQGIKVVKMIESIDKSMNHIDGIWVKHQPEGCL